jgi:uracil-DNA glycosylase
MLFDKIDMEVNMNRETIENEVQELHRKILVECEKNEKVKNLYKGCQIFFSPFRERANAMVIGINPGAGYANTEGKIVEKFSPLETYEENYNLAQEIKMCFRNAGKENIFETTLATNTFFFATKGTKEWDEFLNSLPKNLKDEIEKKSKIWLKALIDIVSPKIIVCAGTTAFGELEKSYPDDMKTIQGKGAVLEGLFCGIPVVACRRTPGGNFERGKNNETIEKFEAILHDYMEKQGIINGS